jgi:hypothetical protein
MQDKRGEKSSWDLRPIRRMQRGRHSGQEKREILLGPEADPEDAERPAACRTREERNPLGTRGSDIEQVRRNKSLLLCTPLLGVNLRTGTVTHHF